jgi:hypothetical protein
LKLCRSAEDDGSGVVQSLDELLPPEMRRRRVPAVDLAALYPHLSPQQLGAVAGGGGSGGGASGTTETTSSSGSGGGTWNASSGMGGGGCGGGMTGGSR